MVCTAHNPTRGGIRPPESPPQPVMPSRLIGLYALKVHEEAQGGIYNPHTGTWFEDIRETAIERFVVHADADGLLPQLTNTGGVRHRPSEVDAGISRGSTATANRTRPLPSSSRTGTGAGSQTARWSCAGNRTSSSTGPTPTRGQVPGQGTAQATWSCWLRETRLQLPEQRTHAAPTCTLWHCGQTAELAGPRATGQVPTVLSRSTAGTSP